ncbi:MAG: hypothetical protein Q8N23_21045 [Archangium sp.]|nr:hypothetical protein [Archangium sp.]MDP3155180.1 hypothetical protein [Archangium sp.]MDP3570874.1 hypothetical protein [Archangium sp.]
MSPLELKHLGREVKTALELAIVALSPSDLVERLAVSAGLLDAIAELPLDSPAVAALLPGLKSRGQAALQDWAAWQDQHLRRISA